MTFDLIIRFLPQIKTACFLPVMKCYRRILNVSYRDRKTTDYVQQKIEELGGKRERLLQVVKRRKLQWYGKTRHDSLAKTIL